MPADIFLGTQGFSYKDWVGMFYAPRTPNKIFLQFYSQVFDTVELDTTFYAIPRETAIEGWRARTPRGFQFACKLPQVITHEKHLLDAQDELDAFLKRMDALGERLGPILIQTPPQFHYDEIDKLKLFLKLLPDGYRFAVEFRHRSWLREDVYDLLRARNVAWANIDLNYMPPAMIVTADFTYIRWLGKRGQVARHDRLQIDRSRELDEWTAKIRALPQSVARVYGYFNDDYAGYAPGSVMMLRQKLHLPQIEPQRLWPSDAGEQERLL